jgi:predicted nuclease of restriction endonuclease-like (RecB) superfamily
MNDPDKREYYELEAIHNGWNCKELERQVNSGWHVVAFC